MAWTATITQKGIVDKAFLVNVSYSNGTLQFTEVVDMTGGSPQRLSDIVTSRLSMLEVTQALIPQITTGPYTPIPPVTPPAPTADQQALQQFLLDFSMMQSMKRAVNFGLKTVLDPDYVALQSKLASEYQPAFLPYI